MENNVQDKLADWLRWDKNTITHAEIEALALTNNESILRDRLCTRLAFGTAGLRGVMQAGFGSMNDLVIIQTAQGLLAYMQRSFPDAADAKRGIIIGFDGRHNSERFAKLTAAIFLHAQVPVWLYGQTIATPFIPFAVTQLDCLCGVMVTASHNPKEDNGYKVYWRNGAQIIGPHDKGIEAAITEQLQPRPSSWDVAILDRSEELHDPLEEMCAKYLRMMVKVIPSGLLESNSESEQRFVYSAMHGVGYEYVKRGFKSVRLPLPVTVAEQRDPNPDFPTVRFPNPEEPASLAMAMQLADAEGISIVIANDPDADRLACAERSEETGVWRVFTGNEIGALLGWWTWRIFRTLNAKYPATRCVMLSSTVSSKVLATIASYEGFEFEETLTGFKWMGNRAAVLAKRGMKVLFAFEEAIGFMVGSAVLDKDGVSAAVHLATLAAWLRREYAGCTIEEKLKEIWELYGYHVSDNSYYICREATVIAAIFERIRTWNGVPGKYPETLCDEKYTVLSVRDLTTGYDSSEPDQKAQLPCSKSTQMITFTFANGVTMTFRTSGTEPKIKYYSEMVAPRTELDWEGVRKSLVEMVAAVVEELFQPELNKLTPRE